MPGISAGIWSEYSPDKIVLHFDLLVYQLSNSAMDSDLSIAIFLEFRQTRGPVIYQQYMVGRILLHYNEKWPNNLRYKRHQKKPPPKNWEHLKAEYFHSRIFCWEFLQTFSCVINSDNLSIIALANENNAPVAVCKPTNLFQILISPTLLPFYTFRF